jgi:predicted enzyme related to lactoylglutathione lyase
MGESRVAHGAVSTGIIAMNETGPPFPAITCPVSRHLPVTDAARSVAFYRGVLGFEEREVRETYGANAVAEIVSGPARLQLDAQPDPPCKMLFFESSDVKAMHAAIAARGGKPSEVERVNWIKEEMFEVRDPDGHVLWFGQSFDRPCNPVPAPMILQALPELPLDDVPRGVAYYRDVLGFKINYAQDDLGVMDRDHVTILLVARTERHKGIGSCGFYVRDADVLLAELTANGAKILSQAQSMPWGLRVFLVEDEEGNRITFAQPFE